MPLLPDDKKNPEKDAELKRKKDEEIAKKPKCAKCGRQGHMAINCKVPKP